MHASAAATCSSAVAGEGKETEIGGGGGGGCCTTSGDEDDAGEEEASLPPSPSLRWCSSFWRLSTELELMGANGGTVAVGGGAGTSALVSTCPEELISRAGAEREGCEDDGDDGGGDDDGDGNDGDNAAPTPVVVVVVVGVVVDKLGTAAAKGETGNCRGGGSSGPCRRIATR